MPAADDQPAPPPASVRNVGAVASLSDAAAADYGYATVDLCLFASTGHRRARARSAATVDEPADRASKLAGLELSVQMSLRLRAAPTGARLRPGSGSPASLPAAASRRTPATLHGLGFALVPDDELKAAQAASALAR